MTGGKLTLSTSNSYTGATSIGGTGILSAATIGDTGSNGNLGAGTQINFGSIAGAGTLLYTGSGETTGKTIALTSSSINGGTIDQSGTGLLKFTSFATASILGANSHTLTLQGSTAGSGEISGNIVDKTSAQTTAISKAGSDTWTLSGSNSFTGGVTVTGGKLVAASTTALGAGTVGVSGTGQTLAISGGVNVSGLAGLTMTTGNTLSLSANLDSLMLTAGTFTLGNETLNLNNAFNSIGTYKIIDGVNGAANSLGTTTISGADTANYNFAFGLDANKDAVLTVQVVPEPASLSLMGLAAVGMICRRRRVS